MAYGVKNKATDQLTRDTDYSVKVAEKLNNDGDIVEYTTHGAQIKITETFVSNDNNSTNLAVAGQVSTDEVVESFKEGESYGKYSEVTVTKIKVAPKFADNATPATTTPA